MKWQSWSQILLIQDVEFAIEVLSPVSCRDCSKSCKVLEFCQEFRKEFCTTLTQVVVSILGNGLPHWVLVYSRQVSHHFIHCTEWVWGAIFEPGLQMSLCCSC